jgi:hypothetical protein
VFLDELGIVKWDGAVDRDGLTLCRRDAELITHADSVARFQEAKATKEATAHRLAASRAAAQQRASPEYMAEQADWLPRQRKLLQRKESSWPLTLPKKSSPIRQRDRRQHRRTKPVTRV